MEGILTGRQWVNNPFESGIFPVRNMSISDDEDFFIYDNELYPKIALTPRTLGNPETAIAPAVILDPLPGRSAEGRGIKILPQK